MNQLKCNCEINAEGNLPYSDLVKNGTLTVDKVEKDQTMEIAFLTCANCKTKWKYTWDDSYHHIIIDWSKIY